MDTTNKFAVSVQGTGRESIIIFSRPLVPAAMTRSDALNLAAWLVALADRDGEF